VTARGFLPPWTAELTPNCFIVRKLLGKDETRRIAALLRKRDL